MVFIDPIMILIAHAVNQALFNVMLREFGVKGVKVQEVVSLEEEMMAFLKYEPGLKSHCGRFCAFLFFFFLFH